MKFAHARASGHFTFAEQIFHRKAISLARKGKFRCVPALWQVRRVGAFFLGGGVGFKTEHRHRGMKFGIAPHAPDDWGRQLAAGGGGGS